MKRSCHGARCASHPGKPLTTARLICSVRLFTQSSDRVIMFDCLPDSQSRWLFNVFGRASMTLRCALSAGISPSLPICVQPDWQAFGKGGQSSATEDLIWLAELLGCRQALHTTAVHVMVFVARGVADILAAVKRAGGMQRLAAADPDAAACLGCSLLSVVENKHRRWLPGNIKQRVERAFAALGPVMLRTAAAKLRSSAPGCLWQVHVAVRLTDAFLRGGQHSEGSAEDPLAAVQEGGMCQVCRHGHMCSMCSI